jgi:hypothetical protein
MTFFFWVLLGSQKKFIYSSFQVSLHLFIYLFIYLLSVVSSTFNFDTILACMLCLCVLMGFVFGGYKIWQMCHYVDVNNVDFIYLS